MLLPFILNSKKFSNIETKINGLAFNESGGKRVDRLSTMCTRLYLYITSKDYKILDGHSKNLVAFLLLDAIPNDLRMSMYMDLTKNTSTKIKGLIRDKKLAKILLQGM